MKAHRVSRALVAVACSVGVTLATAQSADAGTYLMRTCNVPGAQRTSTAAWHWLAGGGTFANDDCATGGGFGLNVGTMTSGYTSGMGVGTDGTIAIRRARLWLVARLAGTGSTLYAVAQYGTAAAAAPAMGLFNPPGGETLTTPWVSPEFPADTAVFYVFLNCGFDAGAGVGCTPSSTTALDIKGAELTLEESLRPTASIDGGELMADGAQAGVRALAYTANDAQSGVARVTAVVGKTVAGSLDFGGDCAYAALAACPRARNGTIAVDTRKVPDGIYPVSLTVTDVAGNQQTAQAATAIRVANNAASSSAPTDGALSNARLTAAFAANRRSTLTVGYGRKVVIRGRLRGPDGSPIGGVPIDLEELPASGGAQAINGAATTGPDGIFSYALRRGPSRTLTFRYGAAAGAAGAAGAVKQLRLRVKASATLRVGLKGIVVRYRGRVLSKPLPQKGKLVEIQGRAPGAGWRTFARQRANRRGGFAGTYRLRVHRPGVRLQFRVRVPREKEYPFVAHAGRAVTRIVR